MAPPLSASKRLGAFLSLQMAGTLSQPSAKFFVFFDKCSTMGTEGSLYNKGQAEFFSFFCDSDHSSQTVPLVAHETVPLSSRAEHHEKHCGGLPSDRRRKAS